MGKVDGQAISLGALYGQGVRRMFGSDLERGHSVDERAPLLQFPGSYAPLQDSRRKSYDDRAPLSQFPGSSYVPPQDAKILPDAYKQFCQLVGNKPLDHPPNETFYPPKDSLYHRALNHRKYQGRMYVFSSTLTNGLLLSQIALGAALTGLGASNASAVVITVFGALNTIIAGLIAFLKSRGQPMRARMFRDDLDRVVDEIENSATMWRGISQKVHGYDAIDTDESVTVRSEVARLTRLYDRAVRTNTINDPDFYGSGISGDHSGGGLRNRGGQTFLPVVQPQLPVVGDQAGAAPVPAVPGPAADPDESPATKAPTPPKKDEAKPADTPAESSKSPEINGKQPETTPAADSATTPAPAPAPSNPPAPPPAAADPDASPATALKPPGADKTKAQPIPTPAKQPETSGKVPGSPPDANAGASKNPGGFM
ncbi:hypothetical protein HII31_04932 [Pseudocercospora fuligena]|uniref:SMODS and SLOG-associating 2TM effector domain-containing protein n=1 Tax=Pseudocercospora fuligena TaxID=685502 RepID=A0A8H6VP26_9PEZI|nr:hypothetical protein HII31_04932 [Pseudocercospora fuligena]